MMNSIPVCFYPLKKIILDDDRAFIDSISLKLHKKNFQAFSSPNEALQFLNQYKAALTKTEISKLLHNESTLDVNHFDVNQLQKILTNAMSNDISILFTDYHMPQINGLEFLNKTNSLSIKRALITGETDYKIGIDAFNAELVDAYLRKDDQDFLIKLQHLVFKLEWEYFTELSNLFFELPEFSFLKNKVFSNLLGHLLQQNDIKAFCLADKYGSFRIIDSQDKEKFLLFRSKKQLRELAIVADEDNASSEVIKKLNEGTVIPYFGQQEYWEIPASQWSTYLYSAKEFTDDKDHIWAISD